MKIQIQNNPEQVVLTLKKDEVGSDFIMSLIKRIEVELMAHKAEVSEDIMQVAEEINAQWWDANKSKFLGQP